MSRSIFRIIQSISVFLTFSLLIFAANCEPLVPAGTGSSTSSSATGTSSGTGTTTSRTSTSGSTTEFLLDDFEHKVMINYNNGTWYTYHQATIQWSSADNHTAIPGQEPGCGLAWLDSTSSGAAVSTRWNDFFTETTSYNKITAWIKSDTCTHNLSMYGRDKEYAFWTEDHQYLSSSWQQFTSLMNGTSAMDLTTIGFEFVSSNVGSFYIDDVWLFQE